MNLNAMETPEGWTFQVAKRSFDKVSFIDRVEDDRYRATCDWHWEANQVGQELRVETKKQAATAEFAGGEHHWALTSWVRPPNNS